MALSSCSLRDNTPAWETKTIQAGSPSFNSAILVSSLENKKHALQLQLIQTHEQLTMFLQVSDEPFTAQKHHPELCEIKITAENQEPLTLLAERHAGGQRLRIPQEFHPHLLHLLLNATMVTIQAANYATRIETAGFNENFQKLLTPKSSGVPVRFHF